jgi:hypothetical protein
MDTIAFNIAPGGVQTIRPTTILPTITDPVVIDGSTQPGFAGTPLIVLSGDRAGFGANGLTITAGYSTVAGLVINGFQGVSPDGGNGIVLLTIGNNLLVGNFIGTDATGTFFVTNTGNGVRVDSSNNTIGGTTPQARNVLSGQQGHGISITSGSGNVVQGNFIGTDVTGTRALVNHNGIDISAGADNTTIGGTAPGAGNLISGYSYNGISSSGAVHGLVIQGNYIGTDVTGTRALRSGITGVLLGPGTINAIIGGTEAGDRNLINANSGPGISVTGVGTTGTVIAGNYIGTDVTGTRAFGNGSGVSLSSSSGTTVGGTSTGARNLISGNRSAGIEIANSAANLVQGNYIGTDATGTAGVGNGTGVLVANASNNAIGGTSPGAGNLISGNTLYGVHVSASNNRIERNYIGTDVTGVAPLGNGTGVYIAAGTDTVGGTSAQARNLISGNVQDGVLIEAGGGAANRVQGNYIGTDVTGTHALANGRDGVRSASAGSVIGGTDAGAGNLISGNRGDGVAVLSFSAFILVQGNRIGTDVTGTAPLGNAGNGVTVASGSYSTVVGGTAAGAGNLISGNRGTGIAVASNNNRVEGNAMGTAISGTGPLGNRVGISVAVGTTSVTIGGTAAGAGNLISGNTDAGVVLAGNGNLVQGNWIGTDAAGAAAVANNDGVEISGSNNTVGGTSAGARNIISGNGGSGVLISGSGATGNQVLGNFIGINSAGTAAVPNATGVTVSSPNVIGGTAPGAGNLISGNTLGISVQADGTVVQGNLIGTDAAGSVAVPNGTGVAVQAGVVNTTIGGSAAGAGNLISGNTVAGLQISGSNTLVQGNLVGTDASGSAALGNYEGVLLSAGSNNTIGGLTAQARNIISGNTDDGVVLAGRFSSGNRVEGNYIGTDVTGCRALGNYDGVSTSNLAGNFTIGGTAAGAGNVISGNARDGIAIGLGDGQVVQGNYIGTDVNGTRALSNGGNGVTLDSNNATIGGTVAGAGNLISGNMVYGISIGGSQNLVQGNLIGTDLRGSAALGQPRTGVFLEGGGNTVGGTAALARNLISGNTEAAVQIIGNNALETQMLGNYIGTDISGNRAIGKESAILPRPRPQEWLPAS